MRLPTITRSRESGFTFVEGLFSILLVSLVLGALVTTLQSALKVRSGAGGAGAATEIDHIAFLMRRDLSSGLKVDLSPSGEELVIHLIDPLVPYAQRRGAGPFDARFMIKYRYFYAGEHLHRERIELDNSTESEVLLQIEEFKVRSEDGLIKARFVQKTAGAMKPFEFSFRKGG